MLDKLVTSKFWNTLPFENSWFYLPKPSIYFQLSGKIFFVKILPKNPYIQSQGRPCLSLIKKFFVSRYLLWQYFCHNHWVNGWICPLVNFDVGWILRNLDPCLCFTMCRSNTHALWIRATCLPPLSDVIVRHVASTKTCPAKSFQWSILTWIKSSSEFITLNSSDIRILLVKFTRRNFSNKRL